MESASCLFLFPGLSCSWESMSLGLETAPAGWDSHQVLHTRDLEEMEMPPAHIPLSCLWGPSARENR
jgi:hypothetical protein